MSIKGKPVTVMLLIVGLFVPLVVYPSSFGSGYVDVSTSTTDAGFIYAEPQTILGTVINFLLGLVGVVAVLAIIIAGVRLIAGTGNEEQAATAKKIILWAIVGLVVIILAWVIIQVVLTQFVGV